MIVPSSRLLFWVACVTLPAALLAAASPASAPFSILLAGGLGIAALGDAWAARRVLAGIGLELPRVTRMSKDRKNKLDVRIRNDKPRARALRIALGWPPEVLPADEELDLVLPAGSGWSELSWTCSPTQRGKYKI